MSKKFATCRRRCQWKHCRRAFTANTTGCYCSRTCKKMAQAEQRRAKGFQRLMDAVSPHRDPGPRRPRTPRRRSAFECMCIVCHGPLLAIHPNAILCSDRCRQARTFRGEHLEPGYRNTGRRMLHAWRREQMAILMHVRALVPGLEAAS